MSPHLIVLLTAMFIAGIGKLVFPQWTLRIVTVVALGLPLAIILALGEPPSLLGLMFVSPLAAVGAIVGVAAAALMNRSRHKVHGPDQLGP